MILRPITPGIGKVGEPAMQHQISHGYFRYLPVLRNKGHFFGQFPTVKGQQFPLPLVVPADETGSGVLHADQSVEDILSAGTAVEQHIAPVGCPVQRHKLHYVPAVAELERKAFPRDAWSEGTMRSEIESVHTGYWTLTDGEEVFGYVGVLAGQGSGEADVQTIGSIADQLAAGTGLDSLAAEIEKIVRNVTTMR